MPGYTIEQIALFLTALPTILLSTIMGALRVKQTTPTLKSLCFLIFFTFLTELVTRVLWFYKIPNLFIWPVYMAIEFGILVWMYSTALENVLLIRTRTGLVVGFACLLVGRTVMGLNPFLFDSAGRPVESVIILSLVLAYFYKTFQELKVKNLRREPLFWVSSGLLLYFSGSLLIFIFANFVLQYSKVFNYQIWIVHSALNALLYSAYTYALWISSKS